MMLRRDKRKKRLKAGIKDWKKYKYLDYGRYKLSKNRRVSLLSFEKDKKRLLSFCFEKLMMSDKRHLQRWIKKSFVIVDEEMAQAMQDLTTHYFDGDFFPSPVIPSFLKK
jgi:hypothetical protein